MMNRSHLERGGEKKKPKPNSPPRRLCEHTRRVIDRSIDRRTDGRMDHDERHRLRCDTVPWNHDGRLSRRGCNGSSSRNRCPRKWIDRSAPAYWNLPSFSFPSFVSPFFSIFLFLSLSVSLLSSAVIKFGCTPRGCTRFDDRFRALNPHQLARARVYVDSSPKMREWCGDGVW